MPTKRTTRVAFLVAPRKARRLVTARAASDPCARRAQSSKASRVRKQVHLRNMVHARKRGPCPKVTPIPGQARSTEPRQTAATRLNDAHSRRRHSHRARRRWSEDHVCPPYRVRRPDAAPLASLPEELSARSSLGHRPTSGRRRRLLPWWVLPKEVLPKETPGCSPAGVHHPKAGSSDPSDPQDRLACDTSSRAASDDTNAVKRRGLSDNRGTGVAAEGSTPKGTSLRHVRRSQASTAAGLQGPPFWCMACALRRAR